MARTDFTQEIDGAFADRNRGMRHYSEIARSGNGNMRRDLADDLADYQELAGVGAAVEEMSATDNQKAATQGMALANLKSFRGPRTDETPPMAAQKGFVWLRKMTPTGTRQAGGKLQVRATWVQVSKLKLDQIKKDGGLQGIDGLGILGMGTGTMISLGLGVAGGLALWLMLRRKKK